MTGGVCSALRFLIVAWSSVTLLTVSGCGPPVSNDKGAAEPDAVLRYDSVAAEPETIPQDRVYPMLVANVARVTPGESFRVGVLFNIPEGSHIYWRNPGASGLASGVEWTLHEGLEVGELQWPAPQRFEIEGWDEVSFGYESKVLLFAEVRVPSVMMLLDVQWLLIAARAYWLNCEEDGQCIPGDAELQLEIPVRSESKPSSHVAQFEQSRLRVPVRLVARSLPVYIERTDEGASFGLLGRDGARILPDGADGPDFFPYEGEAWTWTHDSIKVIEPGSIPDVMFDRVAESFYFVPPEDGASRGGVLKFSVEREDSGTRQTFYISMDE